MKEINRNHHRPLPQHLPNTQPFNNGVTEYSLNSVELEFAHANRLDLIPTAKQRGLPDPVPLPQREFKVPKEGLRKEPSAPGVANAITKAMLSAAIASGMTNTEIGKKFNVSASTISVLLKNYGLASKKGIPRQRKKGRKA